MEKTGSAANNGAVKPATAKKELEKPETERIMAKPAAVKKEPVKPIVEKNAAVPFRKKA